MKLEKISLSGNLTGYKCATKGQAIEILNHIGVPFDRAYVMPTGSQGVWIHIYFNNGPDINMAYFTPSMETLAIIEPDGRVDDIPQNWRKGVRLLL